MKTIQVSLHKTTRGPPSLPVTPTEGRQSLAWRRTHHRTLQCCGNMASVANSAGV